MANWEDLRHMFDSKNKKLLQHSKQPRPNQDKASRVQHHANNQNDKRGH